MWPVLLQLAHSVLFLPVTGKRGNRKACQLHVPSHRPALLPVALQPMSSLFLCATKGPELQETSLIFYFNWIFTLNLNLKFSPHFFKEREEGMEIREPSMITDFVLKKKVWSEPTVANWHFNETWRFRICHNYNFFLFNIFHNKREYTFIAFLEPPWLKHSGVLQKALLNLDSISKWLSLSSVSKGIEMHRLVGSRL